MMHEPADQLFPNGDTIANAIEMLCPAGALLLVSIDPRITSNNTAGRTFQMPAELHIATAWAVERNELGHNVYWTPNEAREIDKKSSKADMVAVRYFWADCDPSVFKHGGYEAARQAMFDELLGKLTARASFVIDSGHGLQAFWRLDRPLGISGFNDLTAFESLNTRLGALYGSPSTQNIDRVMRLPGTVNYVGASKISKGYPEAPTLARMLSADGVLWDVRAIEAFVSGQELNSKLEATMQKHPSIAARWNGSSDGLADSSGSGMDQSVVTMLALAGWPQEEIRIVLERWPHGSAGGRQQGERYWSRMFGNAAQAVAERDRQAQGVNFPVFDATGGAPPVSGKARLPIEYADDLDESALSIPQIVEDWFTTAGLSVVFGESNSGKTYIVIDLVCAVARGAQWMGKRTVPGAILYVAGEGAASVRMRLLAYMRHHAVSSLPVAIVPVAVNLLDRNGDTSRVIEAAHAASHRLGIPISMIVVDTLARAMGGGNENASEDMSAVVSHADTIRQATGAHLMFIHHSGKDTTRGARGSSALRAAVDTEVEVTADASAKTHTATFTKQRDLASKGEAIVSRFLALEFGCDQWGKPQRVCIVEQVDPATIPVVTMLTGHQRLFLQVARTGQRYDVVRTAFYRGLPPDISPDARQKAFVRVAKWARETGLIDVRDEILWRMDNEKGSE
jgi:hypothetical protein